MNRRTERLLEDVLHHRRLVDLKAFLTAGGDPDFRVWHAFDKGSLITCWRPDEVASAPLPLERHTLLSLFCSHGQDRPDLIESLIAHGADLNRVDAFGLTPLFLVIKHAAPGCSEQSLNVIQLLLEAGCDVNAGRQPPLILASTHGQLDIMAALLDSGANIEQQGLDDEGYTCVALGAAIDCSQLQATKLLYQRGAKLTYGHANVQHNSALQCAASQKDPKILSWLLQLGVDVNEKANIDGVTALHLAASLCGVPVLRLLVDAGARLDEHNRSGHTPLYNACCDDNIEALQFLVSAGARLFETDCSQCPCNAAAQKGHTEALQTLMSSRQWQSMCTEDRLEAESMLLHYCADVKTQKIALQYALDKQHMVRTVRECGGETALHTAVCMFRRPASVTGPLIKLGVDLSVRNTNGQTVAEQAREMGLLIQAQLLERAERMQHSATQVRLAER